VPAGRPALLALITLLSAAALTAACSGSGGGTAKASARPAATAASPQPTAASAQPTAPDRSSGQKGPVVRGIYRFNSEDWGAMASAGFNAVTDGNSFGPAQTAARLAGMVWLGSWSADRCAFELSPEQMAARVDQNRGVNSYFQLGDEPNVQKCPGAPAAYRQATALIHLRDPTAQTWVADDQFNDPNLAAWPSGLPMQGTVDIVAFDVYPCQPAQPCRYNLIDEAVLRIHQAGVKSWQFILPDFNEPSWRQPTPGELTQMYEHWQGQGASGYWLYAWDADGVDIRTLPGNLEAVKAINQQPV